MLQPHLRGAENVARGMKRHPNPVDLAHLAEWHPLGPITPLAEPLACDAKTAVGDQVITAAPGEVVAVRMRDHSPMHGPPWVDEEIAKIAIQAGLGDAQHAGGLKAEWCNVTRGRFARQARYKPATTGL